MADFQQQPNRHKKRSFKKKLSTGAYKGGHRQIKSSSRNNIDSSPSVSYHSAHKQHQLQHSLNNNHGRFATTNNIKLSEGNHHHRSITSKSHSRSNHKRPPSPNKKRKNKIKSKNRAHRYRYSTTDNMKTSHYKSSSSSTHNQHRHTVSNPSSDFKHAKFNMTEMQLVIGQIAQMKKSWKTPDQQIMGRIYQIIDMQERPHLNGKYCKVLLILDDENYRIQLLGNGSEFVVDACNLFLRHW